MRHYEITILLLIVLSNLTNSTDTANTKYDNIPDPNIPKETPEEFIRKFLESTAEDIVVSLKEHNGKGSFKRDRRNKLGDKFTMNLFKELFMKYDKDLDGKCTPSEIQSVINDIHKPRTGRHFTLSEIEFLMSSFDTDGDGLVSVEEMFEAGISHIKILNSIMPRKLASLFGSFGVWRGVARDSYKGYKKLIKKTRIMITKIEENPGNLLGRFSEEWEGKLTFGEFERLFDYIYYKLLEPLKATEDLKIIFNKFSGLNDLLDENSLKEILVGDLKTKLVLYKKEKIEVKKSEEEFILFEKTMDSMRELALLGGEKEFDKEAEELYGLKTYSRLDKKKARKAKRLIRKEDKGELKRKGEVEDIGEVNMYIQQTPNSVLMDLRKFRKVVDELYEDLDIDFVEMNWTEKNNIYTGVDLDKNGKLSYEEFKMGLKKVIEFIREQIEAMQ